MEPRYRTVLPIAAILLVVIVALLAFFITRKIRNSNTASASPSPTTSSIDLILPEDDTTGSTAASPAASGASASNVATGRSTTGAVRPSTAPAASGLASVRQQPVTGVETTTSQKYSTTFDDAGYRESTVTVASGTQVIWINAGTKSQSISINGLSSGSIAPNASFSYVFDAAKTYTITMPESNTSQTVVVQ